MMTEKTFKKYKLVIDEWLSNGRNGTRAYMRFYPKCSSKSAESNFRKILGNTRISGYVDQRIQELSKELSITAESQLKDLEDIKRLAISEKKYSDAVSATREQNKMLGFYEKDNSQRDANNIVIYNIPDNGWNMDFNDFQFYQLAKVVNCVIVTNDRDFLCPDLEILTLNQKLMDRANQLNVLAALKNKN